MARRAHGGPDALPAGVRSPWWWSQGVPDAEVTGYGRGHVTQITEGDP